MSHLQCISAASPPYRYSTPEVVAGTQGWLQGAPEARALFERFAASSQIKFRSFALPLERVLSLNGMQGRAEVFSREAVVLAQAVMADALKSAGCAPHDVDALIFTSCSVPALPSVDVQLVHNLGLAPTVRRIPMFQHGCGGGAVALALAGKLADAGETAAVVSVELCSLVYQADDQAAGALVGSVLFGDGAACAVVRPAGEGLNLKAAGSFLIPDSRHLMGYDILDDGTHLRLEREMPGCLAAHAPAAAGAFLAARGLAPADIGWWLFHPGGRKILEVFEAAFQLERRQCRWAWEVLEQHGNMSSASILFVISKFMTERVWRPGERALVMGVGPGLSLEFLLFECGHA